MITDVLLVLGGVLIGLLLMGLVVWMTMPSLMLIKHKSSRSYDDTLSILSERFPKKQDWHQLKITDYQESTAPFGAMERVCSMNVCNPRYAWQILSDDANRGVTAFMPLAIGVYEDKKKQVFISQLNVRLLGMMFGGTISKVMNLAGKDINEVIASVSAK
jgi:uncharacterized protein (DUF302 family)